MVRSSRVRIRLAHPTDAPVLARLRYEFRHEYRPAAEPRARFLARCTPWMRKHLRDPHWRCWVATIDDAIVGHAWLGLFDKIPNPSAGEAERHGYLTNCYVRPAYRNRGIGGRLVKVLLAWTRRAKVDAVILWPSRTSRSLYERHGARAADDILEIRR